jgi:hypothetical protein
MAYKIIKNTPKAIWWQYQDPSNPFIMAVYKTKKYWRLGHGDLNKAGKLIIDSSAAFPEGKALALQYARRLIRRK